MDPSPDRPGVHPVLACVDSMALALAEVAETEVAYMAPVDRRAALLELVRVESRAASLRLRLLQASDDLARDEGARDVAALVTHHARTDGGADRRDLVLAASLERWGSLAVGLSTAEVNLDQARVIAHALDTLPVDEVPERGARSGRGPPGRCGCRLRPSRASAPGPPGVGRGRARGRRAAGGPATRGRGATGLATHVADEHPPR